MRLLLTGVDERHTEGPARHRRTGRQHLRITVEAEVAGVEAAPVADTPEAEVVDTLAVAEVDTPVVVADTPVVVADTPVVVARN